MKKLHEAMNVQVANWMVAYVKLHHFHWYVKGPHFQALHMKFEELYNMATLKLDELAERLLTIEGKPASTMKEYLALSTLEEGGSQKEDQMLSATIEDFQVIVKGLTDAAKLAEEEAEDPVTSDMLIAQAEELQKQIWMLKATLG